jgi:Right handed beta helix region
VEGFRGGQSGAVWHRVQLVNCHAFTNGSNGASIGADTTPGDALWDSSISGGSFYSNGGAGILLNPNADSCSITGTAIWGNTTNGILVDGALNSSITGNTLRDNATAGSSNPELYLSAGSQYITISGNTIRTANALSAITEQASASVDYNLIDGNTLASTGTYTITTVGTHTKVGTNQGYTAPSTGATSSSPLPSDNQFLWWTGDPEATATVTVGPLPTAGSLYLHQFELASAQTLSCVFNYVIAAGSALTANECYIGIYDSTGTLRATTGDMSGATYTVTATASSATVTGTGFVAGMVGNQYTIAQVTGTFTVQAVASSTSLTMTTTVPTAVSSATMTPTTNYSWIAAAAVKNPFFVTPYAAAAGRYYVAYMFNGITAPSFKGHGSLSSIVNAGQIAANYRIALSSSTGNTTAFRAPSHSAAASGTAALTGSGQPVAEPSPSKDNR